MSNSQLYYVQYLLGQVRHAALRCLLQYAGHISFTHSLLYSQADVLLTRACHSNRYIPFRAKNACLYCACLLITELTAAAVAAAAAVASLSDVAAYVLPFLSRHQTHFVSCLDCWLIQDGPKNGLFVQAESLYTWVAKDQSSGTNSGKPQPIRTKFGRRAQIKERQRSGNTGAKQAAVMSPAQGIFLPSKPDNIQ